MIKNTGTLHCKRTFYLDLNPTRSLFSSLLDEFQTILSSFLNIEKKIQFICCLGMKGKLCVKIQLVLLKALSFGWFSWRYDIFSLLFFCVFLFEVWVAGHTSENPEKIIPLYVLLPRSAFAFIKWNQQYWFVFEAKFKMEATVIIYISLILQLTADNVKLNGV